MLGSCSFNALPKISSAYVTQPSETTRTKRARKKKTLAALREEGIALMEEQNDLKKKVAALQASCEKQRKENERLKKIKLDIHVEPQCERPKAMRINHFEAVNERNVKSILPDLNVPFGEDVIVSC